MQCTRGGAIGPAAAVVLGLSGCVEVATVSTTSIPAAGITELRVDVARGEITVEAAPQDTFDVGFTSRGRGWPRGQAMDRAAKNTFDADARGPRIEVRARSVARGAAVDVAMHGPAHGSVDVQTGLGDAHLVGVEGTVRVIADRVMVADAIGDVDLVARLDGIDAEVVPSDGGQLRLEAHGDVVLRLPYGLEYALQAYLDPAYGPQVQDLGFDELIQTPDYVRARSGSGAIDVQVYVTGGTFTLWEEPPTR